MASATKRQTAALLEQLNLVRNSPAAKVLPPTIKSLRFELNYTAMSPNVRSVHVFSLVGWGAQAQYRLEPSSDLVLSNRFGSVPMASTDKNTFRV